MKSRFAFFADVLLIMDELNVCFNFFNKLNEMPLNLHGCKVLSHECKYYIFGLTLALYNNSIEATHM